MPNSLRRSKKLQHSPPKSDCILLILVSKCLSTYVYIQMSTNLFSFKFQLKRKNPCIFCIIINKMNVISEFFKRNFWRRSLNIWMNQLKRPKCCWTRTSKHILMHFPILAGSAEIKIIYWVWSFTTVNTSLRTWLLGVRSLLCQRCTLFREFDSLLEVEKQEIELEVDWLFSITKRSLRTK